MLHSIKLTTIGDRSAPLEYLAKLAKEKAPTVLDVGASANPWSKNHLTHVVDYKDPEIPGVHVFAGNISRELVWNEVREYVKSNGKFDFLVCTHTLEDISSSPYVCDMFGQIAKEGFIAIPSKYEELSHPEGKWLGYIHHRWIYDIVDGKFVGYPKMSFLEHMSFISEWAQKNKPDRRSELQFFWKDSVDMKIVNDDYFGPTHGAVMNFYRELIDKGI